MMQSSPFVVDRRSSLQFAVGGSYVAAGVGAESASTARCVSCGAVYSTMARLEAHIAADHLNWVPFSCSYCPCRLPTETSLRDHIQQAHYGLPMTLVYMGTEGDDTKRQQLNGLLMGSLGQQRSMTFSQPYLNDSQASSVAAQTPSLAATPVSAPTTAANTSVEFVDLAAEADDELELKFAPPTTASVPWLPAASLPTADRLVAAAAPSAPPSVTESTCAPAADQLLATPADNSAIRDSTSIKPEQRRDSVVEGVQGTTELTAEPESPALSTPCSRCAKTYRKNHRQIHVLSHLRRDEQINLFGQAGNAQNADFQRVLAECFGRRRAAPRPLSLRLGATDSDGFDAAELLVLGDFARVAEPTPPPGDDPPQKPGRASSRCHLCGEMGVANRRRHVLQKHFSKAVFKCLQCDYTHHYSAQVVQNHIRKAHAGSGAEFSDLSRSTFAEEVDQLFAKAFGPSNFRRRKRSTPSESDDRLPDTAKRDDEMLEAAAGASPPSNADTQGRSGRGKLLMNCLLCSKSCRNDRRHHINAVHLKKPNFVCPEEGCDFWDRSSSWKVRRHQRNVHGRADKAPINNCDQFKAEYAEWFDKCFSAENVSAVDAAAVAQPRRAILRDANTDETTKVDNDVKPPQKKRKRVKFAATEEEAAAAAATGARIRCLLCEYRTREPERHALYHLDEPVFGCPECAFSSAYRVDVVRRHVQSAHPNSRELVVDQRTRLREHIERQLRLCYGEQIPAILL